jgi:lysophospholipase L1-like esterase
MKYVSNFEFKDSSEKIYIKDSESRNRLNDVEKSINTINSVLNTDHANECILIGDSYAVSSVVGTGYSWQDLFENYTGITCHKYSQGSIGFVGITSNTFLTYLNKAIADITNKEAIKSIIVCGGCNDNGITASTLENAISTFITRAKASFPNATIYVGCIGNFKNSFSNHEKMFITKNIYKKCVKYKAVFLNGVDFVMKNNGNFQSDNVHPNENGCLELADAIVNAFKTGFYQGNAYKRTVPTAAGIVSKFSHNPFNVYQFATNDGCSTAIAGGYNAGDGIHCNLTENININGSNQYLIGVLNDSLDLGEDAGQNCCMMQCRLMDANPYPIGVYPCVVSLVDNKIYAKVILQADGANFQKPVNGVSRIDLLYNGSIYTSRV